MAHVGCGQCQARVRPEASWAAGALEAAALGLTPPAPGGPPTCRPEEAQKPLIQTPSPSTNHWGK